jgi:hypothetical protein
MTMFCGFIRRGASMTGSVLYTLSGRAVSRGPADGHTDSSKLVACALQEVKAMPGNDLFCGPATHV